ncbi:MAG: hypothetical protein PHF10_01250 [Patescibacteria group bacterium]|nr:hypothetical protein [Patescibacteria group bacterium]
MKLSKQQLICRIDEDLEVWADERQYILRKNHNQNNDWFYIDLESVIRDIFDLKTKELAILSDEKTLRSVGQAIAQARNYIHEVIRPMLDGYQSQGASTERERA